LAVLDMGHLDAQQTAARLDKLRYPQTNVLKEIHDLKKLIEQPVTRQFKDIFGMDKTVLRCDRTDPTASTADVLRRLQRERVEPPAEDAMDLDEPPAQEQPRAIPTDLSSLFLE
jgi:hypothetical protein